jgi:hypothetical protein
VGEVRDGRSVEVSVPSGCNVRRLKKAIKEELSHKLGDIDADELELYKPEDECKEGGESKETETAYRPGQLVSAILAEGVGVDDTHPILIMTTQPGI